MIARIIVRDTDGGAEVHDQTHALACDAHVGDRLVDVVVAGYRVPFVRARDVGREGVTLRCEAGKVGATW
jgi:hypothetical protein